MKSAFKNLRIKKKNSVTRDSDDGSMSASASLRSDGLSEKSGSRHDRNLEIPKKVYKKKSSSSEANGNGGLDASSNHSRNSCSSVGSFTSQQSGGLDHIQMEGELFGTSRLVRMRNHSRWEMHQSILDCIGQTPIVRVRRAAIPNGVQLWVKCENTNPGGSLKDRLAMGMIEWAEKNGKISKGQTVVEASSGNTGVGMAMVCAARGYPFVCVMSEAFSIERRKLMRFLGARVVLTPKEHRATGMLIKAQELADKHGFFYPKQFENEANAWIHEQTTGPEIVNAFAKAGKKLDHFFMAYGTGGTVLGISRAFKKAGMLTRIHLCEPSNAPMVTSGIPTKYPESGFPSTSFDTTHPVWSPHLMQGWATDFIPKLVTEAKNEKAFSSVFQVSGADAVATSQRLAITEGIFTGISGGGILSAAIKHAQNCEPGTTLLAVLPDTGERYMSTALFENIPVEMTDEEKLLSDSTPSRAPPPPPALSGLFSQDTDNLFDI